MFKIVSEGCFDSAHFLEGYEGNCRNLHGHRYKVVCCVSSNTLIGSGSQAGMVADFSALKQIMKNITDNLDHKLLINVSDDSMGDFIKMCKNMGFELAEFHHPTTAEHLAKEIYHIYNDMLKEQYGNKLHLEYIEVHETPTNKAVYSERR